MLREDVESFGKFLFTLEWLLEVSARYTGTIQFDLIHIDFGNPQTLGDAYGAQEASYKLHEALVALRQALRKTDLVARQGVDFWIITPYSPATDNLSERLHDILEAASQCGLQIVDRDIAFFSLNDHFAELGLAGTGMGFLSYLKRNHARLARQEVLLPAEG